MTLIRHLFTGPMSRTLRRALVVAAYAILLFALGTGWYHQGHLSGWSSLLILSFLLLLRLGSFSKGVLKKAQGTHDERQRELVLRAHSVTYKVVVVPVLISVLLYMYGAVGSGLFEFFFFASFNLMFFLPATVIAWLEPDPLWEGQEEASKARVLSQESR